MAEDLLTSLWEGALRLSGERTDSKAAFAAAERSSSGRYRIPAGAEAGRYNLRGCPGRSRGTGAS